MYDLVVLVLLDKRKQQITPGFIHNLKRCIFNVRVIMIIHSGYTCNSRRVFCLQFFTVKTFFLHKALPPALLNIYSLYCSHQPPPPPTISWCGGKAWVSGRKPVRLCYTTALMYNVFFVKINSVRLVKTVVFFFFSWYIISFDNIS